MTATESISRAKFRLDFNIVLQTLALMLIVGGYIVRAEGRMARFEEQLITSTQRVIELRAMVDKILDNQKVVIENQAKVSTILDLMQKRHDREDAVRSNGGTSRNRNQ
jgi:hypothetical protein